MRGTPRGRIVRRPKGRTMIPLDLYAAEDGGVVALFDGSRVFPSRNTAGSVLVAELREPMRSIFRQMLRDAELRRRQYRPPLRRNSR
jgi:hypothetical protein